ncbi:MAG: hypothetical protein A2351_00985 [Omnitrophica bacterium RIFOXYB12_FULL_50_7]|nr:MAG: hypothetical protein A2351_00985 [Omnitrophica bacterium RIFOXYB12_FULL_50_7]
MATFFLYLLIVGTIVYFISKRKSPFSLRADRVLSSESKSKELGFQGDSREIWGQVYETASMDEARSIRTRLEEENIDCILYKQGKKDIHGDLLKGVGVAVPGTATSRAQASIAKMPV